MPVKRKMVTEARVITGDEFIKRLEEKEMEPHSAQMEVLDLDLVERTGSDDVEAAVSDDVEGIG
jgi:hypothetical protein